MGGFGLGTAVVEFELAAVEIVGINFIAEVFSVTDFLVILLLLD